MLRIPCHLEHRKASAFMMKKDPPRLCRLDMRNVTDVDRLAARHRPPGQPVMHQDWGKLLFMHWRIEENLLRPYIPHSLEIDTYGNSAWIAITPFTMWDIR